MRMSGRQAVETREANRYLKSFGKMWKSGDKLRVYYPIFETIGADGKPAMDILVGSAWGHSIDLKKVSLHRVFVPTNSDIVDGKPTKTDILYQFSKISKLYIDGRHNKAVNNIAKKKNLSDVVKQKTVTDIDSKFKNESPAVGRLSYKTTTECYVVPMTAEDKPDIKNAALVSQDMSNSKLKALWAILDNAQFEVSHTDTYLEVSYTFGATGDKKEDGKVDPIGVTPAYSLKSCFPDEWSTIAQGLASLPKDSDMIIKRNTSFDPISENVIREALSTYAISESEDLEGLDSEVELERLTKNSKILEDLQVTLSEDCPAFKAIEKYKETSVKEEASEGAPTMMDIIGADDIDNAKDVGDLFDLTDGDTEDGIAEGLSGMLG